MADASLSVVLDHVFQGGQDIRIRLTAANVLVTESQFREADFNLLFGVDESLDQITKDVQQLSVCLSSQSNEQVA